jgi:hypothetical protein
MFHIDTYAFWGVRVTEQEYRRLDRQRRATFGNCGRARGNVVDPYVAVVDRQRADVPQEAAEIEAKLKADGRVFFLVAERSWMTYSPCCRRYADGPSLDGPDWGRAVVWHCARKQRDECPLAFDGRDDVRRYVIVTEVDADRMLDCTTCGAALLWGDTVHAYKNDGNRELCDACVRREDVSDYDTNVQRRPPHWAPLAQWPSE